MQIPALIVAHFPIYLLKHHSAHPTSGRSPKFTASETPLPRLTPNDLHNFVGTDNSCHAGNVVGINCHLMNFLGPGRPGYTPNRCR